MEHLTMSFMPSSSSQSPVTSLEDTMRQHRVLSEERREVLQNIRRLNGFHDFLRAVPFSALRAAGAEGPVIIINISNYRSDAIVIYKNENPILVPLPDTSPQRLLHLTTDLIRARTANAPKNIIPILQMLWKDIVSPVCEILQNLGVAKKSRIWWCPTGISCGLPLHAVGPYQRGHKNLPDIFVSSYTPTLAMLIRARAGAVARTTNPRLLVMGQPGDNLDGMLPDVREELRRIHSFGDFVTVMAGDEANLETVLNRLSQHPWVHFACHGHLQNQPFHSYFQLQEFKRLTVLDLMKKGLPNAEFALLSACHSAAGDYGTPDEVIHLAAAVHFSGFRSVVGTLWAMADIDGPDLAENFYDYMFRDKSGAADFKDAAVALNKATREMRKRKGMTIDRWINFVHIGA